MTLAEWLFKNRRTMKHGDLAKKLNISRAYLSRIVNLRYVPSVKLAKEICDATQGDLIWYELIDQALAAQVEDATK